MSSIAGLVGVAIVGIRGGLEFEEGKRAEYALRGGEDKGDGVDIPPELLPTSIAACRSLA